MEGTVNLTLCSLLTAFISLSQFFILLFEQIGMQKYIYSILPLTALEVYPMTTSAAEKPEM